MSDWTLTVRHGPRVRRERFDDLETAIGAMRSRAEEIRAEGPLGSISAFREYDSEVRVAGRVELSTGGWLRGADAGIDVKGDGSFVAYTGGIRKTPLDDAPDPFEAVRRALK